jgi:hypothetical protein
MKMSKYINAETLIEMLKVKADMALGTPKAVFGNAIKMIDLLPLADVVEVVRCKDCKHKGWKQEPCHGKSTDYCRVVDGLLTNSEESYCSYGERKESND